MTDFNLVYNFPPLEGFVYGYGDDLNDVFRYFFLKYIQDTNFITVLEQLNSMILYLLQV